MPIRFTSLWLLVAAATVVLTAALVAGCGSLRGASTVRMRHEERAPTFEAPKRLGSVRILLDQRFTGFGDASMQLMVAAPGMRLPRHSHAKSHEVLYILAGRAKMFVFDPAGGQPREYEVRRGMAIWIPRGVEHAMSMVGYHEPLRALQLYTPGGPEQRFRRWKRSR